MLRIKVFQNGLTRIYMTNSFKLGSRKNEFYNFLEAATNVNLGHKNLLDLKMQKQIQKFLYRLLRV